MVGRIGRVRTAGAMLAVALSACTPPGPQGNRVAASATPMALASPTQPAITPPVTVVHPGTLTFLSDTTYPPQESIDPATQQAVGFDIDIARALAGKMGLTLTIVKADTPQIISALLAKKGDAAISAIAITPDQQREVAFVPYFLAGQSILVRQGNPLGVGSLTDLCGKKVAVQVQSPEQDSLDEANGNECKGNHLVVQTFPTDQQAVLTLKQGQADGAIVDSPVAANYAKLSPDQLDLAGRPFKTIPEGIAVDPKNGELLKDIQKAMLAIYEDGSYRLILSKWNLVDGEIPASQIAINPSPTGP
ncbi:MAG: ABC transporter substrate-binding protein [Candidatus Dormibacteria bacterium]